MCGIGAFLPSEPARGDSKTTLSILQASLLTLEQRGRDSTGVAAVLPDGTTDILKLPLTARVFLLTDAFNQWFRAVTQAHLPIAWMVHTRAATQGAVSMVNAHPFSVRGITSVHNGHVNNYHEVKTAYALQSECDSEVVAAALAESPVNNYSEGTRKLRGSFALIAHDRRLMRSLWVARNTNPLNIIRAGNAGLVLSSIPFECAAEGLLPNDIARVLTSIAKWKTVPANKQYRLDLDTLKYTEQGSFDTAPFSEIIQRHPSSYSVHDAWKSEILAPLKPDLISVRGYLVGLDNCAKPTARELADFERYLRRGLGFTKAYIETHRKALLYFYLKGTRIAAPKGEPVNGPEAFTYKVIKRFCNYKHTEVFSKKGWKQPERGVCNPAGAGSAAAIDPVGRRDPVAGGDPSEEDESRRRWWEEEMYRGRWAD